MTLQPRPAQLSKSAAESYRPSTPRQLVAEWPRRPRRRIGRTGDIKRPRAAGGIQLANPLVQLATGPRRQEELLWPGEVGGGAAGLLMDQRSIGVPAHAVGQPFHGVGVEALCGIKWKVHRFCGRTTALMDCEGDATS